jgi:hypothetical protein
MGPNKGKKALTLKTVPDTDHMATRGLVAIWSGFSLHAGVAFTGTEREKIEKLCRYIARVHLTRFAGVFGPHYKYRSLVVPKTKAVQTPGSAQDDKPTSNSRMSWARLLKRVFIITSTSKPAICAEAL